MPKSISRTPDIHLTPLSKEPARISAQTLYCQKLDFLLHIFATDSMGLSLLVYNSAGLISKVFEALKAAKALKIAGVNNPTVV